MPINPIYFNLFDLNCFYIYFWAFKLRTISCNVTLSFILYFIRYNLAYNNYFVISNNFYGRKNVITYYLNYGVTPNIDF